MKRIVALLSSVSLLLLLDVAVVGAAGGPNPPGICSLGAGCMVSNPAISATILVDTHIPGSTPTAGQATIHLRQGTITTQASFNAVASTQALWVNGCNPALTAARFLWSPPNDENTLPDWVPPFVVQSLFLPFGIITSPSVVPVITQISVDQCLTPPATGWLLMNATIQFLVPAK